MLTNLSDLNVFNELFMLSLFEGASETFRLKGLKQVCLFSLPDTASIIKAWLILI